MAFGPNGHTSVEKLNSLRKTVVCYGETVLWWSLEPNPRFLKWWTALTHELAEWTVWPEAMSGGQAMDATINRQVKSCTMCQELYYVSRISELSSKSIAAFVGLVWKCCVPVDYAGHSEGHTFLILVDAHIKWMEVVPVKSAPSHTTTEKWGTFSPFMVYQKIWSLTTVQCFRNLSGIMQSVMSQPHCITQLLTDWLSMPSRQSSWTCRRWHLPPLQLEWPNSCFINTWCLTLQQDIYLLNCFWAEGPSFPFRCC